MRAALNTWPPPLLRRWILTIAAGAGFFLVGIAVWLASQDRMMLVLSGTLFLLSLVRAVQLFRCFALEDYAVVDGVCIQVTAIPLHKCRKVRLLDDQDQELNVWIGKQYRLQVGVRYRFYFQHQSGLPLPGTWIASSLAAGSLLGVEELNEETAGEEVKKT